MLTYAIILLALGLAFVFLEALLPSGGVLSILAALALVGSLIFAFQTSTNLGLLFVTILVVILPIAIVIGLKLFPHTPIGKRMILHGSRTPPAGQTLPSPYATDTYAALLGRTGRTVTPLRPSGIIEINDERFSAVAEGEFIESHTPVEVVRIDGNSIVVDNVEPSKKPPRPDQRSRT